MNCPACGQLVRVLENDFFGVGLAIHRYVRVCAGCYWTEFILGREPPEPELDSKPRRFALVRFLASLWVRKRRGDPAKE